MDAPLVSVLVPSYQYARYLPEALDSALGQTVGELEVVAIDDGSTDGSADVLRRYADADSRVRLHARENLGMVATWNECLARARGTFAQFLFADDAFAGPDALERLIAELEADDFAALAVGARTIVDAEARVLRTKGYARAATAESGPDVTARCAGAGTNLIGEPSAVMFRRAAAARGFDPRYRQLVDLEMWFHLLRGGSLRFVPQPVCRFRRHDAQQSSVNRGSGLHEDELGRLLETYGDTVRHVLDRRLLAGWSYRLGRHRPTSDVLRRLRTDVDARLGSSAGLARLRYRLARPFHNLERRRRRGA